MTLPSSMLGSGELVYDLGRRFGLCLAGVAVGIVALVIGWRWPK